MDIQLIGFRSSCCYWLCQFDSCCPFNDQQLLICWIFLRDSLFAFSFFIHLFLIIFTSIPSSLVELQHFFFFFANTLCYLVFQGWWHPWGTHKTNLKKKRIMEMSWACWKNGITRSPWVKKHFKRKPFAQKSGRNPIYRSSLLGKCQVGDREWKKVLNKLVNLDTLNRM